MSTSKVPVCEVCGWAKSDCTCLKIQDIRDIDWVGDHHSDMLAGNWQKVDRFVRQPGVSRQEQLEALTLMGRDGMGLDDDCTEAELDEYLASPSEWPNLGRVP
jgi:hypothetical protein